MVEISEIVDRASLRAWLETRPAEDAIVIAHRVAQRVLPIAWHGFKRKREVTPLPFLRCNLASGEACYAAPPEVKAALVSTRAANTTANAANTALASVNAVNAANAANAAIASVHAAIATTEVALASVNAAAYAADTAVDAAFAAANAAAEFWKSIRQDAVSLTAGQNLSAVPLWADGDNLLQAVWDNLVPELRAQFTGSEQSARAEEGIDYSFWIDWYERALKGTETRWEMIAKIALIQDDVWQGDPSVLMDMINAIWGKYTAASMTNAETLSVNPQTGLYRAEPSLADSDELYAEARGKLTAVLDLSAFQEPLENQYSALREELAMLHTANAAHVNAPRMLHSACVRTRARLSVKFQQGVCPTPAEDANCLDLLGSVDEVISDLVSYNDPVKRAVIAKAKVSFELDQDKSEVIAEADDQLAKISEGVLAEQMPELAEVIRDPAASDDEKAEALYVSAARLLRVGVVEGYKGAKAIATETEWWSERGVKLTVNSGKIIGATAAASSPLWLQNAITAILGML